METASERHAKFVALLKHATPKGQNLAQIIEEILHVSIDGAYRRLRNETAFTLEEAIELAGHFGLSLDSLLPHVPETYNFDFFRCDLEKRSMKLYLEGIHQKMHRASNFDDVQFYSAMKDLSIFHIFNFPKLAAFRLFFMEKTISSRSPSQEKFSFESVTQELLDTGRSITEMYYNNDIIELWWEDLILSVLKPIHYYWETSNFEKEEIAFELLDELAKLVDHLEAMATVGKCYFANEGIPENIETKQNFKLLKTEITSPDNTVLIKTSERNWSFLFQNSLDYLMSKSKNFTERTEEWMDNLMKKSIIISVENERGRKKFFANMHKQINQMRKRFEADY